MSRSNPMHHDRPPVQRKPWPFPVALLDYPTIPPAPKRVPTPQPKPPVDAEPAPF